MSSSRELERTLIIQETPGRIVLVHPDEAEVNVEHQMPMSLDTSLGTREDGSKIDDNVAHILVEMIRRFGSIKSDTIFTVRKRK